MAQRKPAPKANYNMSSDATHVVADASSADVNLLAIDNCPTFAPQLTRLVNTSGGTPADQVVVLVLEHKDIAGADITKAYTVPAASGHIDVPVPIKGIESTGSGAAEVQCFWWDNGSTNWNH